MARTMLEAMLGAAKRPATVGLRFHASFESSAFRSFGELDRQARADAAVIRAEGWVPGDRALLVFDAGLEFVRAIYAAFYAGLTVVPAPVTVSRDSESIRARITAIASDCESILTLATRSTIASIGGLEDELAVLFLDEVQPRTEIEWVDPGTKSVDIAVIQYTSGSTGTPRGVVVSHGNLVANQRAIAEVINASHHSVLVGWLPHYHDMGLGMFMQAIHGGFNLVFTSPAQFLRRPVIWLRLLTEYSATVTVAPNFAYDLCVRMVRDGHLAELNLASVRTMITGSEPVRAETLQRFRRRFESIGLSPGAFVPAYGMAETTLLVSGRAGDRATRVLKLNAADLERGRVSPAVAGRAIDVVSCGEPAAEHDVVIVDAGSKELVPPNPVGEVLVIGPNVAQTDLSGP